jgi:hypothetical protein
VWLEDTTTSGAVVTGLDALQHNVVLLPKPFRRLAAYFRLGDSSLERPEAVGHLVVSGDPCRLSMRFRVTESSRFDRAVGRAT